MTPSQVELKYWKNSALFLVQVIEITDNTFRNKHIGHKCDDWYTSDELGKNRWFCKHLVNARKRNKALKLLELAHDMRNPYFKELSPEMLKAADILLFRKEGG